MISKRVSALAQSATIAMNQKSMDLKRKGIDVVNLSLGQPDFNTPDFIKEAAKKALDDNYTSYTPIAGYYDLRKAIQEKFRRDNALHYEIDEIMASSGAKHSLANVILSLINHDDEVIVPAPYWVSYYELVKLAGGLPVVLPTTIKQDFKMTAQQLDDALNQKTKMLIFSSPNNPSGAFYSKEELFEIAKVVEKYPNLYVISDEIYELINFKGKHVSLAAFDFIKERVITINGVSKGFAMTGWRLGYLGATKEITDACIKLQSQHTSAPSSITQRATIAALKIDPEKSADIQKMKKAFIERRNLFLEGLNGIQGIKTNVPDGAFYLFPDISDFFGKTDGDTVINTSQDFSLYLLNKVRVATVPGGAFGSPENIRLSYATSNKNLYKAIDLIKKAVADLH